MSIGSSPPGCDEPFCFAFRACASPLHSQYVLISSLKTPYEVDLARFNCTCFSRSSGNKASSELVRMYSARVSAFPWASRRLQWRLTRSSILSMAHISSGNFTRGGDRISLKRLRARPAVYGFHLPCSLHQLSKTWSPPADITTSKLAPSVRADSTMTADISASSSGTNRNCCCCDHVLRLCCKRQSSTHVLGTHQTRSSRPSWPTRRSLLLCLRTLTAFPSLSGQQASFSSVLVNDSTPS